MPPPPMMAVPPNGVGGNGNVITSNMGSNGLNGGNNMGMQLGQGRNNYKYYDVDGLGAIPEKVIIIMVLFFVNQKNSGQLYLNK